MQFVWSAGQEIQRGIDLREHRKRVIGESKYRQFFFTNIIAKSSGSLLRYVIKSFVCFFLPFLMEEIKELLKDNDPVKWKKKF